MPPRQRAEDASVADGKRSYGAMSCWFVFDRQERRQRRNSTVKCQYDKNQLPAQNGNRCAIAPRWKAFCTVRRQHGGSPSAPLSAFLCVGDQHHGRSVARSDWLVLIGKEMWKFMNVKLFICSIITASSHYVISGKRKVFPLCM